MRRGLSVLGVLFGFAALALGCTPPFEPPPTLTLEQLFTAGHFRQALDIVSAQDHPDPYQLSRAQAGLGQFEPALASIEKAVAADPNNAAYHAHLAAVLGRLAERASVFKQLSLARRTRKEFETAVALDPHNQNALWGLMLYSWSAPSFLGGDKAKAEKLAVELAALDPARGALARAALAREAKDLFAEEAALRKAVAADDPARPISAYDAHSAYTDFAMRGVPIRATVAADQSCAALTLDPTRVDAWETQIELAALQEHWTEADALIAAAAVYLPNDLAPEYHSALSMIALGKRLDTAEAILRRYIDSTPQGDEPTTAQARTKLATLLEKRGDRDAAIALLRQAIKDDPTLEEARQDLKRILNGGS